MHEIHEDEVGIDLLGHPDTEGVPQRLELGRGPQHVLPGVGGQP